MHLSRREAVVSAAFAAAVGLTSRIEIIGPAHAQKTPGPVLGFYRYKIGDIEVTALYDGIWEKPHDPAFIRNATVEDTKAALTQAGLPTDFVSIPLTVVVLKIGEKYVMIDSGSGAGQWMPTAGRLADNMKAAGITPEKISTILISHFHPDHIYGLMEKGTNNAMFPDAELIVCEYV
jgi:glyoxylase-like metal-dependent hydrolase (beta-lactamase superfamily II)